MPELIRWLKRWPIFLFTLLVLLHTDMSLTPTLKTNTLVIWLIPTGIKIPFLKSLSELAKWLIIYFISVSSTVYGYWFLGWVWNKAIRIAHSSPEKLRFLEQVKHGVLGFFNRLRVSIESGDHKLFNRVKRYGYGWMILIGFFPDVGVRTPSVAVARILSWPRGLAVMLITDMVKNTYMMFGWHFLLKIFS